VTSFESRSVLTEEQEFNQEEKRILDLLARGLSREFPNPQRVGCPGPALLRSVALHKLPLSEADPWLDHLGSCSPCFQEFTEIRKQTASQRKRTRMWLAAAAMVLLAVGGVLWVRSRPSGQTAVVAVLDLRGRTALRGGSTADAGQLPLQVPRSVRSLNLELPIGSNEGAYEVALFNSTGAELLGTSATAKLEDHVVVLRVDVDLAGFAQGSYSLGVRQSGLAWTRFPIGLL
jgi:hypothetical protein